MWQNIRAPIQRSTNTKLFLKRIYALYNSIVEGKRFQC